MPLVLFSARLGGLGEWQALRGPRFEVLSAVVGSFALCLFMVVSMAADPSSGLITDAPARAAGSAADPEAKARAPGDTVVGGYGGTTYTYPSTVTIRKPGAIDMTVKDFEWLGQPFKSPIYYGVRVQKWSQLPGFGSMVDFTHAKAIARANDLATFSGTRDGAPVAAKARIGDVFRHLEFSHGHNMLTYNGLFRWPSIGARLRPYVGIGAGITLPHTEIGFNDGKGKRTRGTVCRRFACASRRASGFERQWRQGGGSGIVHAVRTRHRQHDQVAFRGQCRPEKEDRSRRGL